MVGVSAPVGTAEEVSIGALKDLPRSETEFFLLGPLIARCDGTVIRLPQGKQRVLLAGLLLNAGRVVPVDEIVEMLWGPEPPPSARVTAQNYVKRLRKALPGSGKAWISTHANGYVLHVERAQLDISRFEMLVSAARVAARDCSWGTVAAQALAGLALWRGEPLADASSDVLAAREIPRLLEMRLQATEIRIDADLHLGRTAEVIAELRQLADAHPLRERFHSLLMLALYRDERQGEALAVYQGARDMLAEELGIMPGAGLREMHRRVLAADPALIIA